jgi:hypothetical protein
LVQEPKPISELLVCKTCISMKVVSLERGRSQGFISG